MTSKAIHGKEPTASTQHPQQSPLSHPLREWPWRAKHIENTLKNPNFAFYRTDINLNVDNSAIEYISELLKVPLKKIAHELKHLSVRLQRTSKSEVQTALKLILNDPLANSAIGAGVHAFSLYLMSMDKYKFSKSVRCLLSFSVGHFFRWLVDHSISKRITDCSVVYLAAAFQTLTEELLTRAIQKKYDSSKGKQDFYLTKRVVEQVIQADPELSRVFGVPFRKNLNGGGGSGTTTTSHSAASSSSPVAPPDESSSSQSAEYEPGGVGLEDSIGGLDISDYAVTCGCQQCGNVKNPLELCCIHSLSIIRDLVSKHHQLQLQQLQTYRRTHSTMGQPLAWSNNAFHSLLYYVSKHDESKNVCNKISIKEWIRVTGIYASHRLSELIDEDDVSQAAKFLLGIDYPPHRYGAEVPLCLSHKLSSTTISSSLPLKLLTCGRQESIRQILSTLGPDGINTHIFQGMTPLMCAANAGDYNLVHMLLDADAYPNIAVPVPSDNSVVIPVETRKWTALSFAVLQGHTDIVKLLLSRGANVEGSMNNPTDIVTETPLQLAAAAGDIDIVTLLLEKGADPFLSSSLNNTSSAPRNRGVSNAIALAVAHGHVAVRHKLLQHQPSVKSNDMLSLQEILAEGYLFQNNRAHGIRLSRLRKLQEALYLACEHGYLDIALELRSIGVMWNLNFWTRCLETAYEEGNEEVVRYLLADYDCLRVDEFSNSFCKDGLLLLFDIFQCSKCDDIALAACKMLQHCYGVYQWKNINFSQAPTIEPRIDLKYVNNKEYADVTFLVEGREFYAHKIVIVTGSERFNAMLSKHFVEGSSPVIEIPDIKYNIFEIIIKYLYAGSTGCVEIRSDVVLDVLSASHFFMLEELQLHCESLAAGFISLDSVIEMYRKAMLYNACQLSQSCLHYFLAFLPDLLQSKDFKELLGEKDLYVILQGTLSKRIQKRIKTRSMSITSPSCSS